MPRCTAKTWFAALLLASAAMLPAQAETLVKVAFILAEPVSGSVWSQSWETARLQLSDALHVPTTVVGPVPENNQVATEANDLISKGYNVVVAEDFAFQPFIHTVAMAHPNVKFILIGPSIEPPLPNVSTIYANLWQVRYAEGVLAGLMTKTHTLGFVMAHAIPSVVAGANGFALGAQSVRPDIKTIVIQTGDWYAPTAATRAAETLAARGADVVAQHEDDTGSLIGAEQAHIWAMGSEGDTHLVAPQTYLSGSVYHWSLRLIPMVKSAINGSWKSENYSGDLKSGLVSLGPINPKVPPELVAKVQDVVSGINAGKISVFKGPIFYNDGTIMVPVGKTLEGAAEVYSKQTGFVKGIVGNVKG